MKRILLSILLALAVLVPSVSDAAMILRQNADGTATWVDEEGNEITVGQFYLNVAITDIATAQTVAVAVPITSAKVTYIQSVMQGDITTANTTLRFMTGTSAGAFITDITNGTGVMTLEAVAGSEVGVVDTFTPTGANTVEKDGVVLIYVDGGATSASGTTASATLTITVAPY